ncbi:hypothetical protein Acr_01g0008180 [Actinidia rufa]|uniref:Transposase (putative) gypsy type domain-containing protein n=1 Tax=Actinidia rufa TaxID=165716 RepID=A0A7J0E4Y1_9ERIC|nr:hypothetical protein Acr_01g0008180 [Actinidia rufa]
MSRSSDVTRSGDLDSLPSWISDHLGEGSPYMTDEVNQSPSSPIEGSPDVNPLIAIHPSVEEKHNIMTLEKLNALRETYSFPPRVRVRLPDEEETITSARPGEVAFYMAAFPAGLRFPLHSTIRLILQFYNIFPAQLVPNAWRSIACSMAMWQVFKYTLSLFEFRNLFSLNSNPKPDQGWLYFKARNKKAMLGGYPSNVKWWKSKFFFVSGDEWEIPEGTSCEGAPRVPRIWGIPYKHYNNLPRLYGDEPKDFEEIFRSIEKTGRFSVPVLLESKSFSRVFSPGSMASRTVGDKIPSGDASSSSGDVELRRMLPHIPELTLLRWSKEKVLDPILDRFMNAPSSGSNPTSESSLDSSLPVEFKSDEGQLQEDRQKAQKTGEWVDSEPRGKKKASSSSKTSAAPVTASSRPGEGTSANLGTVLGPTASILGSPSVAQKLFAGGDSTGQQGKGGEAYAGSNGDEALPCDRSGVGGRLVFGRSYQESWGLAADLEQQLAESRACEQQANDELAKIKNDRDSLADKLERSGVLVNELREALDKAKESAVEEFKSSSEFVVAIEDSAFKYFGEGFDFCKVQLRRHHLDLAIDLKGTVVDQDLLAEQDEAAEENEKEKWARTRGVIKDTAPRSSIFFFWLGEM